MNTLNFALELIAVGINHSGCDSSGNIHWVGDPNNALAALVLAAHEQVLTSAECIALQAAVTNERWLAYQDVRKAPVKAAREARYRTETDALRMKADEDNTVGDSGWLAAITEWKAAKAAIREDLPYEE